MANVWKEGGISNKYVQNFFLVNLKINKKSNILKITIQNLAKGEKDINGMFECWLSIHMPFSAE